MTCELEWWGGRDYFLLRLFSFHGSADVLKRNGAPTTQFVFWNWEPLQSTFDNCWERIKSRRLKKIHIVQNGWWWKIKQTFQTEKELWYGNTLNFCFLSSCYCTVLLFLVFSFYVLLNSKFVGNYVVFCWQMQILSL